VGEAFTKVLLYFLPTFTYWRPREHGYHFVINPGPLGRYLLDLVGRMRSNHFSKFDPAGLPTIQSRRGHCHNYTTICAWALANWEAYLLTGSTENRDQLLHAAEYILLSGDSSDPAVLRLREEIPGRGHVGDVSSMVQGEAISVLCRAWQATNDDRFLDGAIALNSLFDIPVADGGVLGYFSGTNIAWYEEWITLPLRHALAGMVYSLWGIRDLVILLKDKRAQQLLDVGTRSVAFAIGLFDSGFWSYYSIGESAAPYLASMQYHNLHICQLRELAKQTRLEIFSTFASRFERYAKNPISRLRAAALISKQKVSLRFSR